MFGVLTHGGILITTCQYRLFKCNLLEHGLYVGLNTINTASLHSLADSLTLTGIVEESLMYFAVLASWAQLFVYSRCLILVSWTEQINTGDPKCLELHMLFQGEVLQVKRDVKNWHIQCVTWINGSGVSGMSNGEVSGWVESFIMLVKQNVFRLPGKAASDFCWSLLCVSSFTERHTWSE